MNGYEREISLKGMILYVFKKWRSVVICMLAFAVLLSGFKYMNSQKSYNAQISGLEKTEPKDADIDAVKAVLKNEEAIEKKETYLENSLLMELNPASVSVVNLVFEVENMEFIMRDQNRVYTDVTPRYLECLKSDSWKKNLIKDVKMDTEVPYFNEIFSFGASGNGFSVSVKCRDEKEALSMSQSILKNIEKLYDENSENWAEHEVKLVNTYINSYMDNDLNAFQQGKTADLEASLKAVSDAKAAFTPVQIKLYNENTENEKIEEKETVIAAPSVSVKFIILGAVFGAFISCGISAAIYLFTNKVRYNDNITKILGVQHLGEASDDGKKKLFGFIDRFISSFEKDGIKGLSKKEQTDLLVSNIIYLAKEKNLNKVYLNIPCEKLKGLGDVLAESLKEKEIAAVAGSSILKDSGKLSIIDENTGIVLLGKRDVTDYALLSEEVKVCNLQNKNIIGIVTEI